MPSDFSPIRREIDAEKKRQAALAANNPKPNTPATTTNTKTETTTSKPVAKQRNESVFDDDPSSKLVSDNFEKNKNKLPWTLQMMKGHYKK